MENRAATRQSDKPATATLKCRCFASCRGAVVLHGIDRQPLLRQRGHDPLLQRIIGGMNHIGLPRCSDIRAEEDPGLSALDQPLTPFKIKRHSHEPKLVTAQRHEMAVA